MRKYSLSQDALWTYAQRASRMPRYTPPSKGWRWLPLAVVMVVLLLAASTLISSCEKGVDSQSHPAAWSCLAAPHIFILFDSYDPQGFGYFRLVVRGETTECRAATEDIYIMLADGHWGRIGTSQPKLLPPPPHWNTGISDKLDIGGSIRINGSDAISFQSQTPLPTDNRITVEYGETK